MPQLKIASAADRDGLVMPAAEKTWTLKLQIFKNRDK